MERSLQVAKAVNINHILKQNSSSNNSDLQLKVDNRNKN